MNLASVLPAITLCVSSAVYAHPDHDEETPQTIKLNATKSAQGVAILVTNLDAKVSTVGATGKLVWVKDQTKGEATLVPKGGNGMEAKDAKIPTGAKVQATITFADKSVFTGDVAVK
ncbi:MAG: hypothetical protein ACEQSK_03490 [Sphingomonadaceae bacterium]